MVHEHSASLPEMSTTTTVKNKNNRDLSIILIASTIAPRSRTYGQKCLLKLGGKTILELQVETIRKVYPESEIIIVTGDETNRILQQKISGARIVENQIRYTSMVEDLRLAINNTPLERILFINSDYLFNVNAITGIVSEPCFVIDSINRVPKQEIGLNIIEGKAEYFSYKSDVKWTYIAYLEGLELFLFKQDLHKNLRSRLLIHEIFNHIIDECNFTTIEPKGMDINKIRIGYNADIIV